MYRVVVNIVTVAYSNIRSMILQMAKFGDENS